MKITFLGTGTSQGVPVILQPEGYLDLTDSRNWRTRTSIHVELAGKHYQVDAAPEFRLQCIANAIPRVDTFILTHGHADHILGMDDLRRYCDLNGGDALPVYSTPSGLERVRAIYPYAMMNKAVVKGYPAFNLSEMPGTLEVPGGRIHSTLLPHGAIDVLGLIFEEDATGKCFAYFTDCHHLTPEAELWAAKADLLVLDGLRDRPHGSHMTIAEAVTAAQKAGSPLTYLIHMASTIDHVKAEAGLPGNIRLSYDGLIVEV